MVFYILDSGLRVGLHEAVPAECPYAADMISLSLDSFRNPLRKPSATQRKQMKQATLPYT